MDATVITAINPLFTAVTVVLIVALLAFLFVITVPSDFNSRPSTPSPLYRSPRSPMPPSGRHWTDVKTTEQSMENLLCAIVGSQKISTENSGFVSAITKQQPVDSRQCNFCRATLIPSKSSCQSCAAPNPIYREQ